MKDLDECEFCDHFLINHQLGRCQVNNCHCDRNYIEYLLKGNLELSPEEIENLLDLNMNNAEKTQPAVEGFVTNEALTNFFYLLLRDYLPAGDVENIVRAVEKGDGKTKVLSNFHLASYAEDLTTRIQKTK